MIRLARAVCYLAAALATTVSLGGPAAQAGSAVAADFTLTDQHGRPFRLHEQRGRVVLLFFGYAHCPDVCPVTLSTWARVRERLAQRAAELTFVFVTVDPERDSLERLREHLAIFDPEIIGLGGTLEMLQPVYEAYGVQRNKVKFSSSAVGYVVDHTSRMLLIDREGRLRSSFDFDDRAEEIAAELLRLLDPEGPAVEVEGAWSHPARDVAAVYLKLRNTGRAADRLIGARSAVCRVTELHRTTIVGDRATMSPLGQGIPIGAGESVELRPGGDHLMLFDLVRPLEAGERFELVLEFESSGSLAVAAEVKSPS